MVILSPGRFMHKILDGGGRGKILFLGICLVVAPWVVPAAPVGAEERIAVLEFLDIPCPGHVATILEAARLVGGVAEAKVYYDSSRGVFSYDDTVTDAESIVAAMPHDCPARVACDGTCPEASGDPAPPPAP